MVNDVLKDAEDSMKKAAEALRNHLATIRTGRASPALVEHLHVEAYGATMPLNQLASITVPDPRMLVIQPFDANTVKAISKAIMNSEIGITPSDDGRQIRLAIPTLTETRRKELVKMVHARVEEQKIAVRNVRRDAVDLLRMMEKDKDISEDESRRAQTKVQELTDKFVRELDHIGATKEAEVMEI